MSKELVRRVFDLSPILGLSSGERDVLAAMASVLKHPQSIYQLSKSETAKRADCGPKTVQRQWRKLEKRELIKRVGRLPCESGYVIRWRLNLPNLPVEQAVDNPDLRGVNLTPLAPGRGVNGGSMGGQLDPHRTDTDISIESFSQSSGRCPVDNSQGTDSVSSSLADARSSRASFDLSAPPGQVELPMMGALPSGSSPEAARRRELEDALCVALNRQRVFAHKPGVSEQAGREVERLVLALAQMISTEHEPATRGGDDTAGSVTAQGGQEKQA